MKYSNIIILVLLGFQLNAQKYFTKSGQISFYSEAPMEKIEAHNTKGTSVMDIESGEMEWAVLIKAFQFEKALMQEHFNENYMESSKYPKSKFKGKIMDVENIDFTKDGNHSVVVKGQLTIHGVQEAISAKGNISIENGQIQAKSIFTVQVADYDIDIPSVVRENIAKEVEIHVLSNYMLFSKS